MQKGPKQLDMLNNYQKQKMPFSDVSVPNAAANSDPAIAASYCGACCALY